MILVATSRAGMEGSFRISLLSNYRTEFQSVWPPDWLMAKGAMGVGPQGKLPKKKDSLFEKGVKLLMGRVEFEEDSDEEDKGGGDGEGGGRDVEKGKV